RSWQQVDVGHPDERDPVPAVGPHRAAAPALDARRRLATAEVADEDPVLNERHGLPGHALVVPAERAHTTGRRRVRDDRHEIRAVAEMAVELVRRQKARARVAGLRAEHPVELRRMAAGLVDLEIEL